MAYDIDTYVKPIDYDEFHLTALDATKWPYNSIGGTGVEIEFTGSVWRMKSATGSADIGQAITGPIDVYWKTTLPASPANLANNSFWINDPDYYHSAQLRLAYGDFGAGVDYYVGSYYDKDGDDYQTDIKISQAYVWFRCEYDPESPAWPRFYYSLTTPYWDTDWTEIGNNEVNPEIGVLYEIALQFGKGSADWASFDFFRGWSVGHEVDEFDDQSIADFWSPLDWALPDGEHADGYFYKTYAALGTMAMYQPFRGAFDLWTKVDIGSFTTGQGSSLGAYYGLVENEYVNPPTGYWGAIDFSISWTDIDYMDPGPAGVEALYADVYIYMWNLDFTNNPVFEAAIKIADADAEGLAIDSVFFRQRWEPDTNTLRIFWSLTDEPTSEEDWTEFKWDVPEGDFDHIDTSWLPDGLETWDEMRAILRTLNWESSSWVGYYFWCNAEYVPNTQKGFFLRTWPREFVYDEFNDAVLGPHWEGSCYGGATAVEQEGQLRLSSQWGQQAGVRQTDLPIESYDIWTRFELSPEFVGEYGDLQFWFEDTGWDGDGGVWFRPLTTEGEYDIGVWMDSDAFGNYFEVNKTIYQNYVYLRLKLDYGSPSMAVTAYYSLREPQLESDWISLGTLFPDPGDFVKAWEPTGRLYFYQMGNPDDSGVRRTGTVAYWRKWWERGEEAALSPSVDQYQRLQGYPKVVHQLVWNRNIGEFEVMEQPRATAPSPTVDADYALAYDTDGNLVTIDMTVGGITYRKTLSYTSGNLSGVSTWIEQ